jgi:hypothetical protein
MHLLLATSNDINASPDEPSKAMLCLAMAIIVLGLAVGAGRYPDRTIGTLLALWNLESEDPFVRRLRTGIRVALVALAIGIIVCIIYLVNTL